MKRLAFTLLLASAILVLAGPAADQRQYLAVNGNPHTIEYWSFPTQTARLNATGFFAQDIGKIAYEVSTGEYFRLRDTAPTWDQVSLGPSLSDNPLNILTWERDQNSLSGGTFMNNVSDTLSRVDWSLVAGTAAAGTFLNSDAFTTVGLRTAKQVILWNESSGGGADVLITTNAGSIIFSNDTTNKRVVIGAGLMVGTTTDPGNGIADFATGFKINGAAASGNFPIGDGTKHIESGYALPSTPGTSGNLWASSGSAVLSVTPASFQGSAASPTGTAATSGVMMGIAGTITPSFSGRILITVSGSLENSSASGGAVAKIRYGTGTKPANAAALTGTAVGGQAILEAAALAASKRIPASLTAVVTGLAVGTPVWLDSELDALSTGTASWSNVAISAEEF
jgi:hypothetical protein